MILGTLDRAGAVGDVAFERSRRLWRSGRCKHEAKAQGAQIEMQIVFVLQQRGNLVLMAGRNKPWRRKFFLEILDDVVALDVHGSIVDENRYQAARIDAEE